MSKKDKRNASEVIKENKDDQALAKAMLAAKNDKPVSRESIMKKLKN